MIFISNKYTHLYYKIISLAKIRDHKKQPRDGYQTHHIIPKSLGGSNDKSNLVVLTYKEHRVCHRLLIGMTQGNARYKMMYAYKLFNREYDISGIPAREIHSYNPEQYVKAVKTRKQRGSYPTGENNNFAKEDIIQSVKDRMIADNPMKRSEQRDRMAQNNNNPYVRKIKVNDQVFPTLASAANHFCMSVFLLKKTYQIVYLTQRSSEPRQINYPDKYVTPWGIFKTKKDIQRELSIPEWTLNTIFNNLDAYPITNGRASKKMSHISIDSSKTWRQNGFDLLSIP